MSIVNKRDHEGLPGQVLAEKIWQVNLADESWREVAKEAITDVERRLNEISEEFGPDSGIPVILRNITEHTRRRLCDVLTEINDVLQTYLHDDPDGHGAPSSWLLCLLIGELIRAECNLDEFLIAA